MSGQRQRGVINTRKRDELMSSVEERNIDLLIGIVRSATTCELTDTVAELSNAKLEDFWQCVYGMCTSSLLSDESDLDDSEYGKRVHLIFKAITDLAQATVTALLAQRSIDGDGDVLGVPQSLKETAILLHDMLPNIEESHTTLKNQMCRLFETWWLNNLEGRQEVAVNTMLFLLDKSTQSKSFQTDVSRVWTMRSILPCVDLEDQDGQSIVSHLQRCMHHYQFVSSGHGSRFLAFVMCLNSDLMDKFHKAIKNVIATTPSSWHAKYGEIYLRSWLEADEYMRQKMEEICIQDLMYQAVHSSRQGPLNPAAAYYKVMGYIHRQKTQRGVESMLVRLYAPILWRSLKAPNSEVRHNAACLMFNAFPLQDPNHLREEADASLQRQFDIMTSLLTDPVVDIRVTAVSGIGRILSLYWELIPVQVIQSLITTLVQDMIYDTAAPSVREAVIKVMFLLCDNHLCIPMLKKVLPELKNLIHDNSEKVRMAMLNFLHKVKGLRAIKYWNIVPMDHILSRLETDSSCVVRKIMNLIYTSFVPINHPPSQQIERCLTLINSNRAAAREFYLNLSSCLGIEDTAKYILVLCRYALESTRLWSQNSVGGHLQSGDVNEDTDSRDESDIVSSGTKKTKSENSSGKRMRSSRSRERNDLENEDEDDSSADRSLAGTSGSGETVFDMNALSGLMEAVYLMFTSIVSQLNSLEHAGMKEGLMKKLSVTVRELIKISDDGLLEDALVGLAGHLPSRTMPLLSQNLFNKLKQRCCSEKIVDSSSSSNDLISNMVKTLVQWGRADDLFDLVEDSISTFLKRDAGSPAKGVKHSPKGKKKVVGFVTEESTVDLEKAQHILNAMLSHAECRLVLISKHSAKTAALIKGLEKALYTNIEALLKFLFDSSNDEEEAEITGNRKKSSKTDCDMEAEIGSSLSVFKLFMRVATFLCLKPESMEDDKEKDKSFGYDYITNCLSWLLQVILPKLSSFHRKFATPSQLQHQDFIYQLAWMTVKACGSLLMVGINDEIVTDKAGEFCMALLRLPLSLLPTCLVQGVLIFTYQLTQLRQGEDCGKENQEPVGNENRVGQKDGNGKEKTCSPSKNPLEFALLVLELSFKVIAPMNELEDQLNSKTHGSKSRMKGKTTSTSTSAGAYPCPTLPTASKSILQSTVSSLLLALLKPGVCTADLFDRTIKIASSQVIQDMERLCRLELLGGMITTTTTTTAAAPSSTTADDDRDNNNDDVATEGSEISTGLTGLNQIIINCLVKRPKTMSYFTDEIISHLESSDQVNVYSLQGIAFLTDVFKSKFSNTAFEDLKDAIKGCVKTVGSNGMDYDAFRDARKPVEQIVRGWNETTSSSATT